MSERDQAASLASDPRGMVPSRLYESGVLCSECHMGMRRGTHFVFLNGRPAHASIATCKAATRRAARSLGGHRG